MNIGVVFPQTEIGADRGAIRSYVQRVEELGFTHLLAYDHILGADPAVHTGWSGPYDVDTTFHEPNVEDFCGNRSGAARGRKHARASTSRA
ncbi:MAG: hypothetical protein WBH47_10725 [Streptosporangiaceae bacterium]